MAEPEPSGSRQDTIRKFTEICAVNEEIAQQALADTNWNLEAAIRVFLDGDDGQANARHEDYNYNAPPEQNDRVFEQNEPNQAAAPTNAHRGWSFIDWMTSIVLAPVKVFVWSLRLVLDYFYTLFGGPPLPLTDPREEVRNFVNEFRTKYDQNGQVPWLEMSYNSAINESRRLIRYLLVYVHNPTHRSTDDFSRNYLLSPQFLAFLQQNDCLIWGASIRSSEGYKVCSALHDFNYPFVALLCMNEGRTTCIFRISGEFTLQTLLDGLQNASLAQRFRLDQLQQEREQREMDSRLRREQEADYERALAADRARVQERRRLESERLENQKREEEHRRQEEQKLADLEALRQQIRASLPKEPAPSSEGMVRVAVRFPNGAKMERLFDVNSSLELLFNVVFANENCPVDFTLVSNYPRQEIKCAPSFYRRFSSADIFTDNVPTFRQAGFSANFAVMVRDNDA